jgi:alpha-tubulin suppressor-like RCC1 family protein
MVRGRWIIIDDYPFTLSLPPSDHRQPINRHSGIVVNVPPMKDTGYLYTFGSGFQGQLGLETCQTSTPTLLAAFCNGQVHVRRIFCGHSHNAAITSDGNLWTWGSNKHGALGRSIDEEFTPRPGIVAEFGTIVNRIGRGLPRSVGK